MTSRARALFGAGAAVILIAVTWAAFDLSPGDVVRFVRDDGDEHDEHSLSFLPHPDLEGVFVAEEDPTFLWAQPLDEADWVEGDEAAFMRDDDFVIGFRVDGRPYALAWWHLDNHHVANLEVDGQPLLVSFCEMCSSAVGLVPVIDGRRHQFRVVGQYKGSILVSDYETNSLWAPFSGEGLDGEHRGRMLGRLQTYQGTWKDWLEVHPDTRVARADEALREGHGADDYPGREVIGVRFRNSLTTEIDPRLPPHTMIVGVSVGGTNKAYSIPALQDVGSFLNDTLGGRPIIVHVRGSLLSTAFEGEIDGRRLTFEVEEDGDLRDLETGSLWGFDGEATEGPLEGRSLTPVQSQVEEWYIWASYRPDTRVYGEAAGDAARR